MHHYFFWMTLAFLVSCSPPQDKVLFPSENWETSTLQSEGMKKAPLDTLIQEVNSGTYGNVDKILIIKNGKIVLDQSYQNDYQSISQGKKGLLGCGYKTCPDSSVYGEYNYYHPRWHPYYENTQVHTLQSITKSISSVMIGVAMKDGDIKGTDVKAFDFFEDYDLSGIEDELRDATLENLLTMQLGMEWHEIDRPPDSTNTTGQLEQSDDWIQFTLDQPMDTVPGAKWVYNSGASHLMSGIIKKATGEFIDAYAEKHLFGPLGITDYHWKRTPTGYPDTEGGLYLAAEDLARIGYLMLHEGKWMDKQVISPEWARKSIARHAALDDGWGYGYQWWRPDQDGVEVWAGLGFGGQRLLVFPTFNMIVVINSWNIFDEDSEDILPATISAVIEANTL